MEDRSNYNFSKKSNRVYFGSVEETRYECKKIIELNIKLLETFGIIFPNTNELSIKTFCNIRTAFFVGFAYLTMLISEWIYVYLNCTNLTKLMSTSFLPLAHLTQTVKFYYIFRYQKRLVQLLNSLSREEFKPKNRHQCRILKTYIKQSQITSKLFLYACIATCSFWGVYPFTEEQLTLPLDGWYPFNVEKSPNFEIVFVYQIICNIINGLTDISKDTLISGFIITICAQLAILGDSLQRLTNQNEIQQLSAKQHKDPELQKIMNQRLLECISHHKCILEFSDEFSFIFSISIFGQFIVSVIAICVTLFGMSLTPFTSLSIVPLILYLFCVLMEIFLWCFYGNEVTVQSAYLLKCIYESSWNEFSQEYQKNMLIFMTRLQTLLCIKAGGFFPLSLDTFVKIVKSSWSYFAVLLNVNSE